MESTYDWHEFVEDDLETHPRDGTEIIYRHLGPLSIIGPRPEGVGREVSLKRWRYLNVP
jgi:hypothetical protein